MTARAIVTRDDFVAFLEEFQSDLAKSPNDLEQRSLGDFLEAMTAWTRDMDGYYRNAGLEAPQKPDWQTFADILNGAKVYE
jgi:heme oxygenase